MPRDRRLAAVMIAVLVLALRLPFLTPGYGIDPDAWRIAADGRAIAESGAYGSSRAPGNPIVELAAALVWRGGPLALNGLTALFSAIAALAFALTLQRLSVRGWALAVLALAFTPVIVVNSSNAMDYLWALAFILIAQDAALRGRWVEAGVMLGLATGCRITSLLLAPSFALILIDPARGPSQKSRAIGFALVTLAISAAAFLPALMTYGPGFLHGYAHGYPPPLYVVKNATVDVWGLIGSLALAVAVAVASGRWFLAGGGAREGGKGVKPNSNDPRTSLGPLPSSRVPPSASTTRTSLGPLPRFEVPRPALTAPTALPETSRTLIVAWLLAIALELAAFLVLPHQAEYLIPTVPFVLLLGARVLTPRAFRALAVAIIVSSLALKASELGKPDSPGVSAASLRVGSGRLVLDLRGPLLIEHDRRRRGVEYVERVIARGRTLPNGSVVSAYEWLPFIKVMLGGTRQGGVEYAYVPGRAAIERHRAAGDSLFDLPGAEDESVRMNGIGLHALGSRPLDMAAR